MAITSGVRDEDMCNITEFYETRNEVKEMGVFAITKGSRTAASAEYEKDTCGT